MGSTKIATTTFRLGFCRFSWGEVQFQIILVIKRVRCASPMVLESDRTRFIDLNHDIPSFISHLGDFREKVAVKVV